MEKILHMYKRTGVEDTCSACGLQKTSVPKRTIGHSVHSGLTQQSEGPLAYSASLP